INGDSDSLTPLPGVMLAANSASEAYARAGAKEKFLLRVQKNTGHSVNDGSFRAAIDWFVTWLKPCAEAKPAPLKKTIDIASNVYNYVYQYNEKCTDHDRRRNASEGRPGRKAAWIESF